MFLEYSNPLLAARTLMDEGCNAEFFQASTMKIVKFLTISYMP